MNLPEYLTYIASMGVPTGYPTKFPPANVIAGPQPITLNPNSDTTNATVVNQTAGELMELATLHNQLLTKGLLITTGTGDNTTSVQPTTTIKRPWLDAPPGSLPFDFSGILALPAVGSSGIVPMTNGVTTYSFDVPQGYDGVINAFSWNFTGGGFVEGSGDIVVQILRNGAAIRNYDNILMEKGTIGIPRQIQQLRVYSNDQISLNVNHAANNLLSGNIVGSFVGYFYPSAS